MIKIKNEQMKNCPRLSDEVCPYRIWGKCYAPENSPAKLKAKGKRQPKPPCPRQDDSDDSPVHDDG